ncbi:UNVERIFIED_ORG: hypothetical protein LHJ69_23550 [Shinella sp. XGS7]|nr:hypothetical protein [Shinella sp. XGS7]
MHRLVFVVYMLASTNAFAGSVSLSQVTNVRVDRDGRAMVMFERNISNSPGCINASAYPNALAIDTNTAGGKAALAMVLAARGAGKRVGAFGTGGCAIYGGAHVEDWDYGVSE